MPERACRFESGRGYPLCAGDLVDGGSTRAEERVVRVLLHGGIPTVVRGNHDEWAFEARGSVLSDSSRRFLRGLPGAWRSAIDGVRIVMVHRSLRSTLEGFDALADNVAATADLWLDLADAEVIITEYTNVPYEVRVRRGTIVNPGALPRAPWTPSSPG